VWNRTALGKEKLTEAMLLAIHAQQVERTGLALALVVLRLNGCALHIQGKELYAPAMLTATGEVDDQVVAAYLRERMTSA